MDAKKVYETVGAGKLHRTKEEFVRDVTSLSARVGMNAWAFFNGLDELLETYGVECINKEETKNGYDVYYLNVGDPYVPTMVYYNSFKPQIRLAVGGYADYVK